MRNRVVTGEWRRAREEENTVGIEKKSANHEEVTFWLWNVRLEKKKVGKVRGGPLGFCVLQKTVKTGKKKAKDTRS